MIEERITQGLSVQLTEILGFVEPVTLAEVKDFLDMPYSPGDAGYFPTHDEKLSRLIVACREYIEQVNNVSLVAKNIVVCWHEMYESEVLPFGPISTAKGSISVMDKNDVAIPVEEYKIEGIGGNYTIYGDFPNGLKLAYAVNTKPPFSLAFPTVPTRYKQAIILSVADVFINKLSIEESVLKNGKNLR